MNSCHKGEVCVIFSKVGRPDFSILGVCVPLVQTGNGQKAFDNQKSFTSTCLYQRITPSRFYLRAFIYLYIFSMRTEKPYSEIMAVHATARQTFLVANSSSSPV